MPSCQPPGLWQAGLPALQAFYEAFFSIPGVQQTALPAPEPASSCCPSPWGEHPDQEGFLGQVPLSCCLPAHPIMGWTEYLISHYLHEPPLLLLEHPEASDSLVHTSCWSHSPVSPSKAISAETQAWSGGTRPLGELWCRTPSPDWRSMRCPSPARGTPPHSSLGCIKGLSLQLRVGFVSLAL